MTFVEDDRISVEHPPSTGQWNLMIKRVEIEDAGVYECQVASTARHLRKHVLLVVKGRTWCVCSLQLCDYIFVFAM